MFRDHVRNESLREQQDLKSRAPSTRTLLHLSPSSLTPPPSDRQITSSPTPADAPLPADPFNSVRRTVGVSSKRDVEDRDPPAGLGPFGVRRTPARDGAAETPSSGKVGFRLCACGSLRDSGPLRTGTDRDPVPHGARVSVRRAAQRVPTR